MKIFRDYGLTIVLVLLFLFSWAGQAYFQYREEADIALLHGSEVSMTEFGDSFLAATFENWQSEFLQLASMVALTAFLIHKGSPQSKDGDEETRAILRRIENKLNGETKKRK